MKKNIILIAVAFFAISIQCFANPVANTIQLCTSPEETAQQCIQEIQNINLNPNANYTLNMDVILPTPQSFTPIGNISHPFTGTFDGQNHVISNLQINASSDNVGMFAVNEGTIKNLSLYTVTLSTPHSNAAALVGYNLTGTIQNINLKDITLHSSAETIGSLVGLNNRGNISNCHAIANITISGIAEVGGLVGAVFTQDSGKPTTGIYGCSAKATVSGVAFVGGLVGTYGDMSSPAVLNESYSDTGGSVTGTGSYIGGLVGAVYAGNVTISNSYSQASVSGNDIVGGFIGDLAGNGTPSDGDIKNSYSSGAVSGSTIVGGFIAVTDPPLLPVTGNNYWDTTTSGQSGSAGSNVWGRTTAEMKTQSTFSGWDFTNIWHIYSGDYPVLSAHTKELTLSGTAFLDQGVTPVPSGSFIGLYANGKAGTLQQIATTTAGGKFSFDVNPNELALGETFLLYILDPLPEGNAIFVANNNTSDVTGINILTNRVYVYSTTPIDDSTFRTALGTQSRDVLFAICQSGQIKFNVPQLDLNSTDNVNIGGLIGSAIDRRQIASLIYLRNWPIPSGKLQMMNSIDLSTVGHPSTP